jgi:3-dehydroquinate synthase
MTTIKSYGYNIYIGTGIFRALSTFLKKGKYSSYFVICDENTLLYCVPVLITNCPQLATAEILEIESGETSKSLEFSSHIWQTLIEAKAGKDSLIINLGGGVVTDLGGFTASIYKRGIDFINIPTSLLAMADASVGGKTGVDFLSVKNAIGTFSQPKAVFIHTDFLNTLPKRHLLNGLAEVYKMALINDRSFWKELKNLKRNIDALICKSVSLKNAIVLKDPFDTSKRKILNFGHTIGHAVESIFLGTENELLHGEAVVIGMMAEANISYQKKLVNKKQLFEIITELKSKFRPAPIENAAVQAILELIGNDKKTIAKTMKFSLITGIGSCTYDVAVTETQVKKAIAYYNSIVND